jgi:hypothetical protein
MTEPLPIPCPQCGQPLKLIDCDEWHGPYPNPMAAAQAAACLACTACDYTAAYPMSESEEPDDAA